MRFLLGCFLSLVPLTLGAQEPVTLGQSLTVGLDASQARQGDATAHSSFLETNYHFDLGLPIVAYRLGRLDLGGELIWARQRSEEQNATALSLSTLGLSGSLFPYQPYHLSFDYQRVTTPDLFGNGGARSDTWGLGYSYLGSWVQSLRMAYHHGTSVAGLTRGDFSSFEVADEQRRGNTDLHLQGERQEYTSGVIAWRSTGLSASAITRLDQDWSFSNHLSARLAQDSRQTQFNSSLAGRSGGWTSVTSLAATDNAQSAEKFRNLSLSQSLAHTWGRLSGFTTAGLTAASVSGEAASPPPTAHLTLGAIFKLDESWSVSGDATDAWVRHSAATEAITSSQSHGLHAGIAWGGGLPEQLAHTLFYWTNLRFQRRLEDDYPPGYLPPDMTRLVLKRRQEQSGLLNFATDFYRTDNDQGHQTWLRSRGGLTIHTGLMLQVMGDLRRDAGFSGPGLQSEAQNLTLLGIQRVGQGSVSFGYGHFRNTQEASSGALPGVVPAGPTSSSATTYSLSANGYLAGLPVGASFNRSIDATGLITNSLMTFTQGSYGLLLFRIQYQHGWQSNGTRGDQISLSLGRVFDTIPLWGVED